MNESPETPGNPLEALLKAFQGFGGRSDIPVSPENVHGDPGPLKWQGFRTDLIIRDEGLSLDKERKMSDLPEDRKKRLRESLEALRGVDLEQQPDMIRWGEWMGGLYRGKTALPPRPLPQRAVSPMCTCGHRRTGHGSGSLMRGRCWNCRDCKGFTLRVGE